ncbi:MAG: AAA family ATPase, partial [Clostridia bacterium]|nr:AAA family ATPase [Clostridia bacterium]
GEGRSGPADRGAWGAWGLRLRALSVARFGALRDLRLGPLGPGLTILAGPNEAGKSTLLAFWVGMLYDLPPLSRGAEPVNLYRPEPADGWGGEVELESPLGPLLLGRRFHEKRGRGRLWLERDGVTLEAAEAEAELARLLGRMERSDYTAVFAFSLAELADLRQLAAGEVGRRIYSAGFGAAEIPAVEQRLEQERNAIWRPQGRTGRELNRLLLELADVERRLAAARGELEQLEPLRRERAETEAELRRLEPELAEAEAEARQLARLLELRPRWREWRRLAQEVERERGLAALPADAVERLEELRRRRERLEERRRRLAEAVAAEEAVLAEPLPAAVLEAAGEVEALLGEWPEQERRLAGAAQLEAELAETERRLEQRAARLGLDPAALEGVVERRPEADEEEGRRHAREALKARERAEALRGQMQQLELAGAEAAAALPAGAGTGALLARAAAGGLGVAGLVALAARLLGGPAWAGWLGLLALAAALAVALAPAGWREAELRRSLETERLRWRSRREQLAEALAAAVREEEQARARLAAWCGRVGIPRGLPAEELEAWLMEAREARDEMARRRRQRERLEALRAEAEAFRRRLAALAGRVGAAAEPAALRQRLEAARGQLQRRERAAAELRRLEAERRQLEAEAAEVEAGVRALLERGGVSDEAELPAVAARAARWREEAARLATLEGELRAGALELWPAAGAPRAARG